MGAAARMVGGEQAHLVLEGDLISRIMVQTCRQSGLSLVYSELLNFAGDEIYSHAEPSLSGRTFAEARLAYEKAAPIGLRRAADGVVLNSPGETRIGPGDMLVLIAEDDSTMAPASATLPALLPDAMAAGR